MGKIIRNGIEYSGTRDTANNINYDGTLSGLSANTVQEAIDEVNNKLNNSGSDLSILQWYIDNGWLPAIPAEGEVPANLEDCSWHMIQQLVQADTFKNYYKVGDTKSITLSNGELIYMQVASINDGSGETGAWYPRGTVDFISKNCPSTSYPLASSTYGDKGGWSGCSLRGQLNNGILNTLPIDVLNTIVEKTHIYYVLYGGSLEVSDKLWLPTVYEIKGANIKDSNESSMHNKMYSIFSDGNCIKTKNDGTPTNWWTPSDTTTVYANACYVHSNGGLSVASCTASMGVPICFRVG